MKNIVTTLDILRGWKEYKRHGKLFSLPLIELFRPNCRHLLNIEILLGTYMYLWRTTENYAKCSTVYGLRYLRGDGMYGLTLGRNRQDIEKRLLEVMRSMILLTSTHTEIDEWRKKEDIDIDMDTIHEIPFTHYRNYQSWPMHRGDWDTRLANLMEVHKGEKFEWNVNSYWKSRARCIIGKYFQLYCSDNGNVFVYCINYSNTFKEASSWEVKIYSEPNESFVDFVIRLSNYNFKSKEILNYLEKEDYSGYRLIQ